MQTNSEFLALRQHLEQTIIGQHKLLDRLMISMLTGGHNANQLPVVLLGGAGGQLETGRILDYREKPNRKMCSLYLSLLDKFGIPMNEFGDSQERLAEI